MYKRPSCNQTNWEDFFIFCLLYIIGIEEGCKIKRLAPIAHLIMYLSKVYNQHFRILFLQDYSDCTLALLLRVNGETGSSTDPYALWESSEAYNDDKASLANTAVDYKSALVDTSWNKIRKVVMSGGILVILHDDESLSWTVQTMLCNFQYNIIYINVSRNARCLASEPCSLIFPSLSK